MKKSYISVVMATHDRATMLTRSVESILQQSVLDLELIIIDDDSRDETPKLLDDLKRKDKRIKAYHMKKNIGPGLARNFGIKRATGEYIAIMDDDDIALPHRLEVQSDRLKMKPSIDMVFSSVKWVNDHLEVSNIFPGIAHSGEFPKDSKNIFKLLYLESNKIPNQTMMLRSETLRSFHYPSFTWIGEDWYLCLKMAASGTKMEAISEPLVLVRRDQTQRSLMVDKTKAFPSQRRVLKMIRVWLKKKGIHDFDNLHRLALSNQLTREARYWGAFRGLFLCYQALLIFPNNTYARDTLTWLYQKGWQKAKCKFQ